MDVREIQLILDQLDFKPKKHLGQNFLTNVNIVEKITKLSEISDNDIILEIGPGLGILTEVLIEKAKKVYAVEIDPVLSRYLLDKFSINNNLEIINEDILEVEIPFHNKVISNIPYKITGPILERVFFKKNPPQGILTVEKSIANRIFLLRKYKNFSRISIGINSFMKPISNYKISRRNFYPLPKIDIALIKIAPKKNIDPYLYEKESKDFYLKLIAGIMPYKNKNIVNALNHFFKVNNNLTYTKEEIRKMIQKNNFENKKLFTFTIDELIELSKIFSS